MLYNLRIYLEDDLHAFCGKLDLQLLARSGEVDYHPFLTLYEGRPRTHSRPTAPRLGDPGLRLRLLGGIKHSLEFRSGLFRHTQAVTTERASAGSTLSVVTLGTRTVPTSGDGRSPPSHTVHHIMLLVVGHCQAQGNFRGWLVGGKG